ncbi:MAG: type II toxin-antitoxin system RelE/ParE family toxin [Lachnospiraceae bacterium]|nr:type II toxin-antitoxin system RelE/ParE family toxin [Lachnospiraceae bacterium]
MDSYNVTITKQAEESMRDIALYIAQNLRNVSAAEGHVDAFLNAIEELSYRATTVKTIPENPLGEMGFHRISVKITGQKSLVSSKYIGKFFSIKPSIFSKALEHFSFWLYCN